MDSANTNMKGPRDRDREHKRTYRGEMPAKSTPKGDEFDKVGELAEKEKAALSIVKVQVGPES